MPKRKSVSDDSWGYFPNSTPIRPADGIKSRKQRGSFGESWWAKRWIAALESLSGAEFQGRLQRGRSYARNGQVLNIAIEPGKVRARVQGSQPRPYTVTITLTVLSDAAWDHAITAMSEEAIFAAQLLNGEMPPTIERAFQTANVSLLPDNSDQFGAHCSCPDYANPCKHIAAVYYLLGEQFDTDPFLIFALRGRTRDQIIDALRARRAQATPLDEDAPLQATDNEVAPTLHEQLTSYWQLGTPDKPLTIMPIVSPEVPLAILRRLGPSPAGTRETLAKLYHAMTEQTIKRVFGSE